MGEEKRVSEIESAERLYRLMLYGEVTTRDYVDALMREVRQRQERENEARS